MKITRLGSLFLGLVFSAATQSVFAAPPQDSRVSVVDAAGGPVAGAAVEMFGYNLGLGDVSDSEPPRTATTGDKGMFSIPSAGLPAMVLVKKAGMAPAWRLFSTPGEDSDPLVLDVPKVLSGTVVDENGRPLADALVSASLVLPRSDLPARRNAGFLYGNAAKSAFSARTGADGAFRIDNFPAGATAMLEAAKPGKAIRHTEDFSNGIVDLPYAAGMDNIKLVMDPGGSIAGKVVTEGTGAPVGGVSLRLQSAQNELGILAQRDTTKSSADGSFHFDGVAAGSYVILSGQLANSDPGFVVDRTQTSITSGQNLRDLKVTASKGGVIEAKVVSQKDGKPVSGVNVIVYANQTQATATTGDDGIARIRVAAAQMTAVASKAGWNQAQESVVITDGQTNQVRLSLTPARQITGKVTDESGALVGGAHMSIEPNMFGGGQNVRTDEKGNYTLPWQNTQAAMFGGMNQTFLVVGRLKERHLAAQKELADDASTVDLVLKASGTLTVKVQDADGKGIAGANVNVWMLPPSGSGMNINLGDPQLTDAQGKTEAEIIPDMQYYVNVSAKGFGAANRQIQSADVHGARYEAPPFTLARADKKIAGRVLGPDGKPVSGAMVNLNGPGQPNGNARTDAQGRFSFDATDGPATIFANVQGMNQNSRTRGGDTNVEIQLADNNIGGGRGGRGGRAGGPAMVTTSGKILDRNGSPVAGARVSVAPALGNNAETLSGSDGHYSISWRNQQLGGMTEGPIYKLIAINKEKHLAGGEALDETKTNVDVKLKESLVISATIHGSDDKPLPNASAYLIFQTPNIGTQFGRPISDDEKGQVEFEVAQNQHYSFNVTASGYGSFTRDLPAEQTQTTRLNIPAIKLKKADLKLAGKVLLPDGQPAIGATVNINGQGQPNGNLQTDGKGEFEFMVCDGPINVNANVQNGPGGFQFGNAQTRGGATNVVVNLRDQGGGVAMRNVTTTGVISGPSGSPAEGIEVFVSTSQRTSPKVKTDAQGHYSVSWQSQTGGAAAQNQRNILVARDADHNLAVARTLTAAATKADAQLEDGLVISGTAKDENGGPLKDASVQLALSLGQGAGNQRLPVDASVASDGYFEFKALPQKQTYNLTLTAPGHGSLVRELPVAQTSSPKLDLSSLLLKLANKIMAGQVVDEEGTPLAGVTVRAIPQGAAPMPLAQAPTTQSDKEGHFEIKGLPEGMARVTGTLPPNGARTYAMNGNFTTNVGLTGLLLTLNRPILQPRQAEMRSAELKTPFWTPDKIRAWPAQHVNLILGTVLVDEFLVVVVAIFVIRAIRKPARAAGKI